VIVSTDSIEIENIARKYGAEIPFQRPPELSDDYTPTAPVINHTINWLIEQGEKPTFACCIYATAPFVQPEFIISGYEIMKKYNCSTSYTVTSFPFPILRGLKLNNDECLEMIWPEHEMSRSQDLPEAYHDAGQLYWVNCKQFIKEPKLYAKDSKAIFLPRYLVQDIDTLEDWVRAECMHKALELNLHEE
jgi:pseudaminic acid cytidylyltransferase